jgi:hypothetical protein
MIATASLFMAVLRSMLPGAEDVLAVWLIQWSVHELCAFQPHELCAFQPHHQTTGSEGLRTLCQATTTLLLHNPSIPCMYHSCCLCCAPVQVLQEGALSIIIFGYDERLLWAKRVGTFIRTMRSVLGDR